MTIESPAPDVLAAPDAPTSPQTQAPASNFDQAGASLREAKTWDALFKQPEPTTPEAPVVPVAEAPVAPAEGEAAPIEFQQDATGRWHRADGTYATNDETAELNAQVAAAPAPETPPADAAAEPIVVTVKGRNGEALEVEVADERTAEILRANANDGMRRDEFTRRMATVESKEAELREFETLLSTNPEAVILKHLPAEKQISIATALVAQHWDAIVERLAAFDQDPVSRVTMAAKTQEQIRSQDDEYQQRVQNGRYLVSLENATQALIPDGVDDATTERFLDYAGRDLVRHIKTHGKVEPSAVPSILAPTLALFGFDKPRAPDGSTAPVPPPARPVARLIAKAPTPTPPSAPATAATVKARVTAQRIAASVPPAGAGAAPMQRPALPSTATLADAVALQKKQTSWGAA